MSDDDARVLVDVDADGVAHVRLNRPHKRNGLDLPMFRAISQTARDLGTRKEVRAVVLSGEGPAFCAGLDVKAQMADPRAMVAELMEPHPERVTNLAQDVAWAWREVPVPVLAWAIAGVAAASGALSFVLDAPEGSAARALWAANLSAGFIYIALGAMLGANTGRRTVASAFLGALGWALASGLGWWIARQISYEPTVIAGLSVGGAFLGALGTGFVVSWVRGRLCFVEHVLVALLVCAAKMGLSRPRGPPRTSLVGAAAVGMLAPLGLGLGWPLCLVLAGLGRRLAAGCRPLSRDLFRRPLKCRSSSDSTQSQTPTPTRYEQ